MDDDRNDPERDDGASGDATQVESELERTRKLILERRNRFMAAALAGIGLTGGQACTRGPSACLSFAFEPAGAGGAGGTGSAGTTATQPCPGQPGRTPPCVCLSLPLAGTDVPPRWPIAGAGTAGTSGAGGQAGAGAGAGGNAGTRPIDVCPGNGGPPPCVCLSAPIDEDAGVENEP